MADRDREKGAEDRLRLVKHVQEDREEVRARGDGACILHLECSRAEGKTHQPATLFRGWANIFCAVVHGWRRCILCGQRKRPSSRPVRSITLRTNLVHSWSLVKTEEEGGATKKHQACMKVPNSGAKLTRKSLLGSP
jgi:hypothetical protein